MAEIYAFKVRSSSSQEVYSLKAHKPNGRAVFTCSCRAGENGTHCKHRISLLIGDVSNLQSGSTTDVDGLRDLFGSSGIYEEVARLAALEDEAARIKAEATRTKRRIAALLLGQHHDAR